VTAPLTPNDPLPPHPPSDSDGLTEAPTWKRDLRDGLIVALLVTVCGLALGGLWLWLAPKVPMYSDGSAIYLRDPEGEQAIGADGVFTFLGIALGVLSGAATFWWRRKTGGAVLVAALAVGGLLASVVAWRFGTALGPTSNLVAHAKQAGVGKTFLGPLQLNAKAALVAWPAAAMLTLLCLTTLLTTQPAVHPQWPGWSDPRGPQQYANPYAAQQPPYPQPPQGQPPHTGGDDRDDRGDGGEGDQRP
jgi:hypothetical protein